MNVLIKLYKFWLNKSHYLAIIGLLTSLLLRSVLDIAIAGFGLFMGMGMGMIAMLSTPDSMADVYIYDGVSLFFCLGIVIAGFLLIIITVWIMQEFEDTKDRLIKEIKTIKENKFNLYHQSRIELFKWKLQHHNKKPDKIILTFLQTQELEYCDKIKFFSTKFMGIDFEVAGNPEWNQIKIQSNTLDLTKIKYQFST
jgi:hypothetical protein